MKLPEIEQQATRFANMGIKVFPIRVYRAGEKWKKMPLTEHGHKDGTWTPKTLDWSRANGIGLVMGNGWYAIDVDSHKGPDVENNVRTWIKKHGAPVKTRIHRTPSGGWHILYKLPKGWENLRTRANVIEGMDTRGSGGWIAVGEGYEVVRDMVPAVLSVSACKALDGGEGVGGGTVVLQNYAPPENAEDLKRKLKRTLTFGPALLRERWRGVTIGLTDKSKSAMDHSVGKLLAMNGWTTDEITWVLLNEFEYGAARQKGKEHVAVRAAGRSAVKGIKTTEEENEQLQGFKDTEDTDDIANAMKSVIKAARSRT